MAITVQERDTSRTSSAGQSASVELRYIVRGTDDDLAARSALESAAPLTYDNLPRQNVRIEPAGPQLWDGEVTYAPAQEESQPPPQQGQSVFAFDTGGGTQHITHSLATVATFAAPLTTAPNFQGAIGVTADNVEGVDIVVPVYQFTETHVFADSAITTGYKITLMTMTGRVNSDSFRGFAAGSVLFLGAAGSKRGDGNWEITFRFAVSLNLSGITVGPMTAISKKGWEYLWVRYEDTEDGAAQSIVKRPVAAYVERVYLELPFSALGI